MSSHEQHTSSSEQRRWNPVVGPRCKERVLEDTANMTQEAPVSCRRSFNYPTNDGVITVKGTRPAGEPEWQWSLTVANPTQTRRFSVMTDDAGLESVCPTDTAESLSWFKVQSLDWVLEQSEPAGPTEYLS